MRFLTRRDDGRRGTLTVVAAAVCSAAIAVGAQVLLSHTAGSDSGPEVRSVMPAAISADGNGFAILDATWTTAHIDQKGINISPKDTGLVVTYLAPAGRKPSDHDDWVGIYERNLIDTSHRKDWDWVCPNEPQRCMSYGSAVVPAGDDGLESGRTYTVAYWANGASESSGSPVATIEYVVPW
ncbi:hypothetical protein ACPXCE_08005 [Streptomyces sp. DT24]|uniref:hypothetical protein n=1 Tax=unclassified Streptomyces TaxID=2593676 RepID=UPI0023B94A29|nr:hypothetical protein [Streptomyces sp. AM 4-1-1]WEH33406.1 hypothetical protein PZB75_08445 [Streptomyces sp. AM 4-1-1]